MSNPILQRYKIQVFIAFVVALGVIALSGVADGFSAIYILAGCLFAILMLDMEYILDSYLLNTNSAEALKLKESFQKGGFKGLIVFFNENETKFKDLPIRSALFQILLTIFGFYIALTTAPFFAVGMVLTILGLLLYTQIMEIANGVSLDRWFWIYNGNVTQPNQQRYVGIMLIFFVVIFWFI